MTKNVLLWDGEWERTPQIEGNLKKLEKGSKIKSLCLVREGQACFQTEGPADWIPRGLSELFSEKIIEHEWAGGDGCGSALWQDGRESRYTVSGGSPEWDTLVKSVEERTLDCETLRDFREKLDGRWQAHVKKWRELTLEQFDEHAAAIAAMHLCYKNLKALSWHRTWIEALNQLTDPLEAVCSAWLGAMEERVHGESFESVFDRAICGAVDSGSNEKTEHMEKTRTMAFQVPEETFNRLKAYLKRHKLKQKPFVVGLVEAALDKDEAAQQAGNDCTDGNTCP